MIQAGDTSRPEQIMPMMANEAGVASTDPPDENPATKGRRRSLPKPMVSRKLPTAPTRTPRSASDTSRSNRQGLKSSTSDEGSRTRSMPTPPSRGTSSGQSDAAAAQNKRIKELEAQLEQLKTDNDLRIKELEAQLEQSWESEADLKKTVTQLEANIAKNSSSSSDKALFEAKERSQKTAIAKMEAIIDRKTREIDALEAKVAKLEREGSDNAQSGETIKQLEARLEASKKRNAEQATELGKFAVRVDSMQALLKDKDEFVSNYRSMIETQTSQLSSLQGMYSNVQAELVSLKVFSNEQSGFVNNLNEENGRLVSEIQRLKSQAETRDRQLHESVAIAKKALLKQKEQNEKLHADLLEARRAAKASRKSSREG